jgi:hypothetical protein
MIVVGFNADMAHEGQTPRSFPDLVATMATSPGEACEGLDSRWSTYFDRVQGGTLSTYFLICAATLLGSLIAFFFLRPRFPVQWTFFNRSLFLFGFGYVWYPYWSGDILHFYGLYLLLGSLIVGLRSRWLILLGAATLITGLFLQYHFDFQEGWRGYEYISTEFWSLKGALRNLFFNGWHPFLPWFAFLLIGMLLMRLNIQRRGVQVALILVGAVVFVVAEEAAPVAQATVDSQIASAYSQETSQTSSGAQLESDSRRPTLGNGVTRKQHTPAIRAGSRLLRALKRKPLIGMEDTRPTGIENFSARIDLDAKGQPICKLMGKVQTDSDADTAIAGLASWVTDRMQAMPTENPWGDDEGWPAKAQMVQLKITSDDSAQLHTTSIPLGIAKEQKSWRQLRLALDTSSEKPGILYFFSATGTALIVIGLSLLLCSFKFGERLRRPFVLAGQCALTLYVGHVLVGWTVIDLLGKSSDQTLAFVLTACALCCWVGISFAALWRSIFSRGPLEMFMRSIT